MVTLRDSDPYPELMQRFAWELPEQFNIAIACCDRHAETIPDQPAILDFDAQDQLRILDFAGLTAASNRLANALRRKGVRTGARIAILLPQGQEVAIAHLATYKLGAIALPLAHVFRSDALAYRLENAGASVLITNQEGVNKLDQLRKLTKLPHLEWLISCDGADGDALDMAVLMAEASADFAAMRRHRDEPCLMIYTSGTTGQPKGALHAGRVLLGHLPGFQFSHQPFEAPDTLFWTPADWAWAGGLLNVLLPALYFGKPVLGWRFTKFDPEAAFALMVRHKVTHSFIPPTALRMMRNADRPGEARNLALQSVASGGEALGAATFHWGKAALGVSINELYGQTECNYVLSSSAGRGVSKSGMIGKPVPGTQLTILDAEGKSCGRGEQGQIAIHRDHPAMFLEYWQMPEATSAKFSGDWMLTGDLGIEDEEGYFSFIARDDDIITSSGYRIGPVEIEECLLKHPCVALAAVIGKPDELRTEIVKAFIILRAGFTPSERLVGEIQDFVRNQLSVYEYPREIAFVEQLPLTSTGKIMRRLLREP